jgi:hypothetical protein
MIRFCAIQRAVGAKLRGTSIRQISTPLEKKAGLT